VPDFAAIGAAIAARYAPGTLATPGGETAVRSSTNKPPDQLGALPAVLIIPADGSFGTGARGVGGRHGTRLGEHHYLAQLYLAQVADGDLGRQMGSLQAWLTILVDAHLAGLALGGLVVAVRTISWRVGILRYMGTSFAGVELRLQVVTAEAWSPS
jgi:hypothetical protein